MTNRDLSKITPDVLRDWLETHGWEWTSVYTRHGSTITGWRLDGFAPPFSVFGTVNNIILTCDPPLDDWPDRVGDALASIAASDPEMDEWTDAYDAIVGSPALTGEQARTLLAWAAAKPLLDAVGHLVQGNKWALKTSLPAAIAACETARTALENPDV